MFIAFACALWVAANMMTVWVAVIFHQRNQVEQAKAWSKLYLVLAVASSAVAIGLVPTPLYMVTLAFTLISAIFTGLFIDALSSAYLTIPMYDYFSYLEARYVGSNDYFIKNSLADVPPGMPWRLQKASLDAGVKILKQFDEMGYKSRRYVWGLPITRHVRFDRVLIDQDRVHYKIAIFNRWGKYTLPNDVSLKDLTSEEICGRLSAALDMDITGYSTSEGAWITVNSFFSSLEKKKRKNNIGLFDTKSLTDLDRAFTAGFNSAMLGDLPMDDEPLEEVIERLQEHR